MNPLKIANLMGKAAQQKASQPQQDDEDLPTPNQPKKSKQVAAAKEQEKSKGAPQGNPNSPQAVAAGKQFKKMIPNS